MVGNLQLWNLKGKEKGFCKELNKAYTKVFITE